MNSASFPCMPRESNSSLAIEDAVSHVSFKKDDYLCKKTRVRPCHVFHLNVTQSLN